MKIFFLNGIRAGESVDLEKAQITLGCELDNDINILAEGVSRYHARIDRLNEKNWIVIDLGSTNGLKVNKEKISGSKVLQDEDIIDLGDQSFKISDSDNNKSKPDTADKKKKASSKAPDNKEKTKKKTSKAASRNNEIEPVIQPVRQDKEQTKPPVQKIIFQPMPGTTGKNSKTSPSPKNTGENDDKSIEAAVEQPQILKDKTKPENKSPGTTEIPESLMKDLDIFNKDNKNKSEKPEGREKKKRRQSSNLLFYTSVVCFAAVFIALFYGYNKHKNSKAANAAKPVRKKRPFVLYYTKEKATRDNVFRFSVLMELNKAVFTIDDLKSERHFNKTIDKINESKLEALKNT